MASRTSRKLGGRLQGLPLIVHIRLRRPASLGNPLELYISHEVADLGRQHLRVDRRRVQVGVLG